MTKSFYHADRVQKLACSSSQKEPHGCREYPPPGHLPLGVFKLKIMEKSTIGRIFNALNQPSREDPVCGGPRPLDFSHNFILINVLCQFSRVDT
jgi:hypothetical protein